MCEVRCSIQQLRAHPICVAARPSTARPRISNADQSTAHRPLTARRESGSSCRRYGSAQVYSRPPCSSNATVAAAATCEAKAASRPLTARRQLTGRTVNSSNQKRRPVTAGWRAADNPNRTQQTANRRGRMKPLMSAPAVLRGVRRNTFTFPVQHAQPPACCKPPVPRLSALNQPATEQQQLAGNTAFGQEAREGDHVNNNRALQSPPGQQLSDNNEQVESRLKLVSANAKRALHRSQRSWDVEKRGRAPVFGLLPSRQFAPEWIEGTVCPGCGAMERWECRCGKARKGRSGD